MAIEWDLQTVAKKLYGTNTVEVSKGKREVIQTYTLPNIASVLGINFSETNPERVQQGKSRLERFFELAAAKFRSSMDISIPGQTNLHPQPIYGQLIASEKAHSFEARMAFLMALKSGDKVTYTGELPPDATKDFVRGESYVLVDDPKIFLDTGHVHLTFSKNEGRRVASFIGFVPVSVAA